MEIVLKPKQLERILAIQAKRTALTKEAGSLNAEESLILEVLFEEHGLTDFSLITNIGLTDGKVTYDLKPADEVKKGKGKGKKAIMEAIK